MLSTAIVLTGAGLLNLLVPIRAGLENFTQFEIGLIGSAYWGGLALGCILAPMAIQRVGHIRAFICFTSLATATPLIMPLLPTFAVFFLIRVVSGMCLASLQMIIESWLSSISEVETRGRIFGSYMVLNLTVVTIGMQMISLAEPTGFELFSLAAVLFSLSAIPISLTRTPAPEAPETSRLRLGWLTRISPLAVFACIGAGVVGGAFWSLAPLYTQKIGLSSTQSATVMTIAVLAGAAAQWPIGLISDRIGRRGAIIAVSAVAAAAGLAMQTAIGSSLQAIYVLIAVFGAASLATYPLALAHANDLVPKRHAVTVSSGLLIVFAMGSVAGPLAAAPAMEIFGPSTLFLVTAIVQILTILMALARLSARPVLPDEFQEDFVVAAGTTPAAFEFDPRGDGSETQTASSPAPHRPAGAR